MATEILAVGTTEANSDDVTVASGDSLAVAMKGGSGAQVVGGIIKIQLKADDGNYYEVGELFGGVGKTGAVIDAAGTYRFTRLNGHVSCGVFSA